MYVTEDMVGHKFGEFAPPALRDTLEKKEFPQVRERRYEVWQPESEKKALRAKPTPTSVRAPLPGISAFPRER